MIIPIAGNNEKNNLRKNEKKKKFGAEIWKFATAHFVLQGWNCIAIEAGWLLGDLKILLQYNYCTAGEGWKILYCNTLVCIAEKRAEIVL